MMLFNKRFLFNFKFKSIINKSGLNLLRPSILQLSKELSELTLFDVEIIPSCLNLNKCETFLEKTFDIHLSFLFIV